MALLSKAHLLLLILQTSGCLSKFGSSGFIEYREGNVGIVIAVPHGGSWDYQEIPNRKYGVLEGDDHTRELGEVVATAICRTLGKCPHLIISNLKRSKLDPNRNKTEAAQGNPKAEKAWEEYQGFIEEAKKVEGLGVVIDLHGQSHRQNSTELGYLLSTAELNSGDYDSAKSSVRQLARRLGKSGKEVMTGNFYFLSASDLLLIFLAGALSLGAYIEKEGYKALPSPRQPAPGEQEYFTGEIISCILKLDLEYSRGFHCGKTRIQGTGQV